jgi:hypothetical protein
MADQIYIYTCSKCFMLYRMMQCLGHLPNDVAVVLNRLFFTMKLQNKPLCKLVEFRLHLTSKVRLPKKIIKPTKSYSYLCNGVQCGKELQLSL